MGACLNVARKILIVSLVILATSALAYGQSGGGSTTLSGLVVDDSGRRHSRRRRRGEEQRHGRDDAGRHRRGRAAS